MASRTLFARGCRGRLARTLQQFLAQSGHYSGTIDGDFGGGTEAAIRAFQQARSLPATGFIDDDGWTALTSQPVPPVHERCLELTAAIEGHGYTLAQGNYDKAGITWGIIGFTLRWGSLTKVILDIWREQPACIQEAFGDNAKPLLAAMKLSPQEQVAWGDSLSFFVTTRSGKQVKTGLSEPWKSSFRKLGEMDFAQAVQARHAKKEYFDNSLRFAERFNMESELGVALCFDIQVQCGGFSKDETATVLKALAAAPPDSEAARRKIVAQKAAEFSSPAWRDDVLTRKMAFAKGAGLVHGRNLVMEHWGLGEFPAALDEGVATRGGGLAARQRIRYRDASPLLEKDPALRGLRLEEVEN